MEKFWWSGEVDKEVYESYRVLMKRIAAAINPALQSFSFGRETEQWAFITIILKDDIRELYPEKVRRTSRGKVLEFRLQIPHENFLKADAKQQIILIFRALHRSVDLMAKLKVSPETQSALHSTLFGVEKEILGTLFVQ